MHVCDVRWQIERVPSGQIPRRRRGGWGWITTRYAPGRHGTASCLSRRGSLCRSPRGGRGKGGDAPGLIPLTVPETRRLILAMAGDDRHRPFRLAWSRWRRAHSAVTPAAETDDGEATA